MFKITSGNTSNRQCTETYLIVIFYAIYCPLFLPFFIIRILKKKFRYIKRMILSQQLNCNISQSSVRRGSHTSLRHYSFLFCFTHIYNKLYKYKQINKIVISLNIPLNRIATAIEVLLYASRINNTWITFLTNTTCSDSNRNNYPSPSRPELRMNHLCCTGLSVCLILES